MDITPVRNLDGPCEDIVEPVKEIVSKPVKKSSPSPKAEPDYKEFQKVLAARYQNIMKEAEEEKRAAAERIRADYAKRKNKVGQEMEALRSRQEQQRQELSRTGLFQFGRKKELNQALKEIDAQIQEQEASWKRLEEQEQQEVEASALKIDSAGGRSEKIRELILDELEQRYRQSKRRVPAEARDVIFALGEEPLTASEINSALGTELTALQIADICKSQFIKHTAVKRTKIDDKGLMKEASYTGYYL